MKECVLDAPPGRMLKAARLPWKCPPSSTFEPVSIENLSRFSLRTPPFLGVS